jgi:hypothetical protein
MGDDRSKEGRTQTALAGVGVIEILTALALASDLSQLLTVGVAVLIVVLAATTLAVTVVALFRSGQPSRGVLAGGVAVIVLATGVLSIAVYRGWFAAPASAAPAPGPSPAANPATWQRQAGPVRLTIPFGRGDKLPQGSMVLSPPGLGPDAYHGDLQIQCETDGKQDSDQNCTGADARTWVALPIDDRALIGAASGDAFTDPAGCDEGKGVTYEADYLEITVGRTYCLRERGDLAHLVTMRVISFSAAQPLPTDAVIETATWSR